LVSVLYLLIEPLRQITLRRQQEKEREPSSLDRGRVDNFAVDLVPLPAVPACLPAWLAACLPRQMNSGDYGDAIARKTVPTRGFMQMHTFSPRAIQNPAADIHFPGFGGKLAALFMLLACWGVSLPVP
jgi:hypothetical protein